VLSTDGQPHWEAITARAVEAWPDHALSYLVTYGVYGLALQHAE
jgi:hypothetical protein